MRWHIIYLYKFLRPVVPEMGALCRRYYRHQVSTSRFSTKCIRYISLPNKYLAELLSRQTQKSVYNIVSCEAVVTLVLIEELFPHILVKFGNVEFYENTFSVHPIRGHEDQELE